MGDKPREVVDATSRRPPSVSPRGGRNGSGEPSGCTPTERSWTSREERTPTDSRGKQANDRWPSAFLGLGCPTTSITPMTAVLISAH